MMNIIAKGAWVVLVGGLFASLAACDQPEAGEPSSEEVASAQQAVCGSAMSINGVIGSAEPGGAVILYGCNFGLNPGKVELSLVIGNSTKLIASTVHMWGEDWVGVIIPDWISGAYDQKATYKITREDNVSVVSDQTQFTALRETRKLDVSKMATSCDAHGNIDNYCGSGAPGSTCTHGACVFHKVNGFPFPIWDADDEYSVSLHPQWVYKSFSFGGANSGADFPWFPCPNAGIGPKPTLVNDMYKKFPAPGTSGYISFTVTNDFTGCGSWDSYYFDLTVTGPKGTEPNQ
jgi:hypothetical protein